MLGYFLGTFPEEDIPHIAVRAGRALLHGFKGARVCDLLHLSIRQAEAVEAGDLTDALAQVLRETEESLQHITTNPEVSNCSMSDAALPASSLHT